MRFLMKVTLPVEKGNALVRDPNMGQRMETMMSDIKPEAVYFCVEDGQRTVYFVVNIESTDLPRILEPAWLTLNADIKLIPAMNQEDFQQATQQLPSIVSKYS